MCGLVAAVWRRPEVEHTDRVRRACDQMFLRGPDADGLWESGPVSLGHRRLAILDPTSRSDQPMVSASGRFRIVFNGEIYNFHQLRSRLQQRGIQFRTSSDTEVLLELFEIHGPGMLSMLRGMFTMAIWDGVSRQLFVARDPYGIKPLYVTSGPHGVVVASQVRALLATGLLSGDPDPWGQATYWLTGSVAEPHTWFAGARSFPPGHFAWVDESGMRTPVCWHSVADDFVNTAPQPIAQTRDQVIEAVRSSVAAHHVSDVPVGVFLSGGIDSGAIAGLLSALQDRPVQAITLRFGEFEGTIADETSAARVIAGTYGLDHHVRVVTQAEFREDRPRILADMDQPSVDGVNSWYASKAIAELKLKVALSGVGGDELFQGYGHMSTLPRLVAASALLSRLPGWSRVSHSLASAQASRSGNPRWLEFPDRLGSLPGSWLARRGLFAVSELSSLMGEDLAREATSRASVQDWIERQFPESPVDPRVTMSLIESRMYLRNQLLRDSDWASMAHSVELRTPLVDVELLGDVAPYLASLRHFKGKTLLAAAPTPPLSDAIVQRPKTGFAIPVQQWLGAGAGATEHPTREWAREVASAYASTN
ncbi:MAG: Asparagine synthetase [Hyphomicrobiales bacterium]|jgi:asparagine synthase (glutamine-hydrolysing)|nr:Asparagine synthetase [Hyphomicrobiales bacterium]